jgi:methionyl-tRNA formyltransferase
MTGEVTYVVAGRHPWNRFAFDEVVADLPGQWVFLADRFELTEDRLTDLDPRYVFFLHWSWLVPDAITDRWECVCFHMTDVPFGRGGSPLQNLIQRGLTETRLTALRMSGELDAGPVYAKVPLALDGSAEEIYLRASRASLALARDLADREPEPVPQEGEVVTFERRRPEQSLLPANASLAALYDFIRMLDADGYPRAFLRHGPLRLEFANARQEVGRLVADIRVTVEPTDEEVRP